MGTKTAGAKIKAKDKTYTPEADRADDPYAHLAAAVILRAYDDLREMGDQQKSVVCYKVITKEELINFFCSDWCATLLSFQDTITHKDLVNAVFPLFDQEGT